MSVTLAWAANSRPVASPPRAPASVLACSVPCKQSKLVKESKCGGRLLGFLCRVGERQWSCFFDFGTNDLRAHNCRSRPSISIALTSGHFPCDYSVMAGWSRLFVVKPIEMFFNYFLLQYQKTNSIYVFLLVIMLPHLLAFASSHITDSRYPSTPHLPFSPHVCSSCHHQFISINRTIEAEAEEVSFVSSSFIYIMRPNNQVNDDDIQLGADAASQFIGVEVCSTRQTRVLID